DHVVPVVSDLGLDLHVRVEREAESAGQALHAVRVVAELVAGAEDVALEEIAFVRIVGPDLAVPQDEAQLGGEVHRGLDLEPVQAPVEGVDVVVDETATVLEPERPAPRSTQTSVALPE